MSDEAADEARELLDRDPYARVQLAVLVELLELGTLKKNKDYRQMVTVEDEPPLYELRLQTTSPQLRLYFIEESHDDGVHATGLLLAPKPPGTADEARGPQNADVAKANERRPEA